MSTITGTNGADTLIGTTGPDNISGLDGDDTLDGGGGTDNLYGGNGDDTLIVHAGSASPSGIIDGGPGTDTVVLDTLWDVLTWITPGVLGGVTIPLGGSGSVTATNVEYAQFANRTVALSGPYLIALNWASYSPNRVWSLYSGNRGADLIYFESDLSGLTITQYQLYDANTNPHSGHFVVNGVVQAAGTVITITAAEAAQTVFVAGIDSDQIQIRAFDGTSWGATDSFVINMPADQPAIITTADVHATPGQVMAVSSLFSLTDAESDVITAYQLFDASPDAASGHLVVNGVVQAAATVVNLTPAQFAQAYFVAGTDSDTLMIRAYDGTNWSAPSGSTNRIWSSINIIPPNPPVNHAPVVTPSVNRVAAGTTLSLLSLFSVSDADGDAITRYQFDDIRKGLSGAGYFVVNGVADILSDTFDVSAAEAAQLSLVTGTVEDIIEVRVFDGTSWSSATLSSSPSILAGPLADRAPVVNTADITKTRSQPLALSSLFSVSDADGDAITRYQLWDSTGDPSSGHFVVDGVAQPAATVIEITAAQLAQTSFVTGAVGDRLEIRAFDGIGWSAGDNASWSPFTIAVPANSAPVVMTANVTRTHQQTLALSSLFSVSDADGDTITKYQLWDSSRDPASGYFVVNGVAQSAATVIEISAAQMAQTSFVTGSVGDMLQVRAFDGFIWSAGDNVAWAPFSITVPPNNAPVVTTANVTRAHQQTLALSSLFSVSDADSDTITRYQLWDSTRDPASGYFVVNGVAQSAAMVIDITAAQLTQTSFVTGAVGDNLQIRAFDGIDWSAAENASWSPFTLTVPANNAPVVTTANVTRAHQQTLALSSLFSVSDADGDAITKYQLWDSTRDPASGHFVVAGVAQSAATVIEISAAQLAQTSFITGSAGDSLQIRAFDGITWSAGDNASWSPFTITVPANSAPVVTTSNINSTAGQSLALSTLFTVNDADGDIPTRYQLWDSTRDPASGHFVVGGVDQPASTVIDITAAQLSQTSFLTGTVGDSLQIRAFDGTAWSAADNASWSPFHVAV